VGRGWDHTVGARGGQQEGQGLHPCSREGTRANFFGGGPAPAVRLLEVKKKTCTNFLCEICYVKL